MAKQRDLFGNFERMRREIDELFGDVWTRAGFAPRRHAGFRPHVDVYYCGDDPSVAVVKADLAGVDMDDVNLEVRGRTLFIRGERKPRDTEGRVYQQLEIERGQFEREIQLASDVDAQRARATYEDGVLRVTLPLAKSPEEVRQVPIAESDGDKDDSDDD